MLNNLATDLSKRMRTRAEDSFSFLYIEHAIIEQDEYSICAIRGRTKTTIPIGTLSCLLLGPGTSITHRAVQAITDTDCIVVWEGEHFRSFYAVGLSADTNSKNFLRQAEYWADSEKHLEVVRRMYQNRFSDMPVADMTLQRLRGAEGKRVHALYEKFAKEYGIPWNGRNYDRDPENWDGQDEINRMLSVANSLLYNICHSVIITLGFSETLGFIHTGQMRSFVWDIADIYKHEITIPLAFQAVSEGWDYSLLRQRVFEEVWEERYVKRIIKDLYRLFDINPKKTFAVSIFPELWDMKNNIVAGGVSYSD